MRSGMVRIMVTRLADPPVMLTGAARLTRAKLEYLPIHGAGSPTLRIQGRFTPAEEGLADLMSSIATSGVLQPILVEKLPDGTHWLVVGTRRLLACRRLLNEQPEVTTIAEGIRSLVCPGPLTELERRIWPLIENLSRVDLTPTELGRDLLFARSALLVERLRGSGYIVPTKILANEDPVTLFREIDAYRTERGADHIGAPWEDVLNDLGMEIHESRAQQIVRAVTAVPPDLAAEMDAAGISISTRLAWGKLAKRDLPLARKIWEEARDSGEPQLFGKALRAAIAPLPIAPRDNGVKLDDVEDFEEFREKGPGHRGDQRETDVSGTSTAAPPPVNGSAPSRAVQPEIPPVERPTDLDLTEVIQAVRQARVALQNGSVVSTSHKERLKAEMGLLFDALD